MECHCSAGWSGERCDKHIHANCTYVSVDGQPNVYPHGATWIDDCNECRCEYGAHICSHSVSPAAPFLPPHGPTLPLCQFWCPHRCALYNTTSVHDQGIPIGCTRPHENCIPETAGHRYPLPRSGCGRGCQEGCAAENPGCDEPVGWCFPVGHIMVDDIAFPTNPPAGFQTFRPNY